MKPFVDRILLFTFIARTILLLHVGRQLSSSHIGWCQQRHEILRSNIVSLYTMFNAISVLQETVWGDVMKCGMLPTTHSSLYASTDQSFFSWPLNLGKSGNTKTQSVLPCFGAVLVTYWEPLIDHFCLYARKLIYDAFLVLPISSTLYSQPVDLQSFTVLFNSTFLFHNVIIFFTVK